MESIQKLYCCSLSVLVHHICHIDLHSYIYPLFTYLQVALFPSAGSIANPRKLCRAKHCFCFQHFLCGIHCLFVFAAFYFGLTWILARVAGTLSGKNKGLPV